MRQPTRHPAVTDLSHDAPTTGSARAATNSPPRSQLAEQRPQAGSTPKPKVGSGSRVTPPRVVGAAAAVVIAGVGFAFYTFTAGPEPAPAADIATTDTVMQSQDSGLPTLNLPTATQTRPIEPSDAPTLGSDCAADRGDQKTGAGVIRAFQYAYYVRRDGAAARALATPDSSVLDAAGLQASIDAVPAGSSYCLSVTDMDPAVHVARMTVLQPGQRPNTFTQTITTEEVDGAWFVATFQQ